MRIAIFHDYIGFIGGAEKLIFMLAQGLNADIITTDIDVDSLKKMGFEDITVISIGETIKIPPFKQISASLRFALCDFSQKYDFFIFSGNWALFAARKHKPNFYYCHTPTRAFYDLYDIFFQRQPLIFKPIFMIWVALHKTIGEHYLKYIEKIITNSKNTQSRIKNYLHRNADVIYPPVDTSRYNFEYYGDFWLSVNRLYPEKRIELQLDAFRMMHNEKLIIVGGYAEGDHAAKYAAKIINNIPENVTLLGSISEQELIKLYATCKGFITTALDEDFGMTPIEAMASGKPTIAVREGGYLETIVDGLTGIFVEPDKKAIIKAVDLISQNTEKYQNDCKNRAKDFDLAPFIRQMSLIIKSHMKKQQDIKA